MISTPGTLAYSPRPASASTSAPPCRAFAGFDAISWLRLTTFSIDVLPRAEPPQSAVQRFSHHVHIVEGAHQRADAGFIVLVANNNAMRFSASEGGAPANIKEISASTNHTKRRWEWRLSDEEKGVGAKASAPCFPSRGPPS